MAYGRVPLAVCLPPSESEIAKRDGAVQAALDAIEDPAVDIDTWEFACSFRPYVWSLEQQCDDRTYSLALGLPQFGAGAAAGSPASSVRNKRKGKKGKQVPAQEIAVMGRGKGARRTRHE